MIRPLLFTLSHRAEPPSSSRWTEKALFSHFFWVLAWQERMSKTDRSRGTRAPFNTFSFCPSSPAPENLTFPLPERAFDFPLSIHPTDRLTAFTTFVPLPLPPAVASSVPSHFEISSLQRWNIDEVRPPPVAPLKIFPGKVKRAPPVRYYAFERKEGGGQGYSMVVRMPGELNWSGSFSLDSSLCLV